ncbi:MAG: MBOAT family O-acyltransferase [Candidatus Omnitrophota bacterium]
MLFNSWEFTIFFIIVYIAYLGLNHPRQNKLLLIASYVFYAGWDWRFLSLLLFSTLIDYFCGIKIQSLDSEKKRKLFLFLSVFGNLLILGFFKYFNFFTENLQNLLQLFNIRITPNFLKIILPVGISFYTFQTMSYTIDIYRRKMLPTKNFVDFALFVAFFPQLVAGPIERAKHLLPQISNPRKINLQDFYQGSYLIFWGLFQKVFIADNLAEIVDPIFNSHGPYQGGLVILGVYAFAFQIFCDFAGYSNIARGLAKMLGFDIMINFNTPYFSTNPQEFWRRWHISLSSWLKDYCYISLGGNRKGKLITYRNLFITMLLGGLWHGASWTFVLWGVYHGVLLIIYRMIKPLLVKFKGIKKKQIANLWHILKIIFFFHLIALGWLIFRAQSIEQFWNMFCSIIFNVNLFSDINLLGLGLNIIFFTWILFLVQIMQIRTNQIMIIYKQNFIFKGIFYYLCFYLMLLYGVFEKKEFIYFIF